MATTSASAVTRHLHYAWIEFGHTGDGSAFTAALNALGWKNIVSYLPRTKDAWGTRYRDPNYPEVPIRWKGSGCLILPNVVKDQENQPPVEDPVIVEAMKAAASTADFEARVRKICDFLGQWAFSPGIKRTSDTDAHLTSEADATEFVDLVACSGHGASGNVWGGSAKLGLHLKALIENGAARIANSKRLKYMLLPTCYNLADVNTDCWLPLFRRANPVHGVFGYGGSYPGGNSGAGFFTAFAGNLKANGGSMSILEAYRRAHEGTGYSDRWAAMIHVSSRGDTMRAWLKDSLTVPDPTGEVRWFSEANWPDGEVVVPYEPDFKLRLWMGTTEINGRNQMQPEVGLFPGASGTLKFAIPRPPPRDHTLEVTFIYFRPQKDGMDLERLLRFPSLSGPGWTAELAHLNLLDGTSFNDGVKIKADPGTSEIQIPFVVREDAHVHYHADQGAYFWLIGVHEIEPAEGRRWRHRKRETFYADGAWLREPRV